MISIRAHLNNIALHHTVFDLPFAFIGALLAAGGRPRLIDILWIAVAITTARAASLAIDNWADLKYDSQQPRMAGRAMVRGAISKREAGIFIAICFLILIYAAGPVGRLVERRTDHARRRAGTAPTAGSRRRCPL